MNARVRELETDARAHVASAEAHVARSDRALAKLHAQLANVSGGGDDARLAAGEVLVAELDALVIIISSVISELDAHTASSY